MLVDVVLHTGVLQHLVEHVGQTLLSIGEIDFLLQVDLTLFVVNRHLGLLLDGFDGLLYGDLTGRKLNDLLLSIGY